jgi:hypoxanthine phosphoribosyltransferase
MNMPKIKDISWEEYMASLHVLDTLIMKEYALEGTEHILLLGLPRGGLLVALHLSYINEIYSVVSKNICLEDTGLDNVVVVDDILETGKTRDELCALFEIEEIPQFVVLYDKSYLPANNTPPADVSVIDVKEVEWIRFPYENQNERERRSQEERGYYGF